MTNRSSAKYSINQTIRSLEHEKATLRKAHANRKMFHARECKATDDKRRDKFSDLVHKEDKIIERSNKEVQQLLGALDNYVGVLKFEIADELAALKQATSLSTTPMHIKT